MARRLKGRVRVRHLSYGRTAYDLVVSWRGAEVQYLLGYSPDWNEHRANDEKERVVKLIELDLWEGPPKKEKVVVATPADPRLNEVISDWWARGISDEDEHSARWAPNTIEAYRYQLPYLAWWKDHRCSEVTVTELDRWLAWLSTQRSPRGKERIRSGKPLSISYKNAIIERFACVLDFAERRSWVERNIARLPDTKFLKAASDAARRFDYLDVDQLLALLAAAQQLDDGLLTDGTRPMTKERRGFPARPRVPHPTSTNLGRAVLLGLLFYAGLREHEAGNVTWQDVLLDEGVLRIREHEGRRSGKTAAGVWEVNIVPAVDALLREWQARTRHGKPSDFVCPTYNGKHRSNKNIDDRVLAPCITRAGERAALPAGITSHWGRRTFATNLADIGETSSYIQDQLGHGDARLAQQLYRQRRARSAPPDPRLFELYGQPHHVRPAA